MSDEIEKDAYGPELIDENIPKIHAREMEF